MQWNTNWRWAGGCLFVASNIHGLKGSPQPWVAGEQSGSFYTKVKRMCKISLKNKKAKKKIFSKSSFPSGAMKNQSASETPRNPIFPLPVPPRPLVTCPPQDGPKANAEGWGPEQDHTYQRGGNKQQRRGTIFLCLFQENKESTSNSVQKHGVRAMVPLGPAPFPHLHPEFPLICQKSG